MLSNIVNHSEQPKNTYRELTNKTINQLQIILSAMEEHSPKHALDACKRIHELADQMKAEIMGIKNVR